MVEKWCVVYLTKEKPGITKGKNLPCDEFGKNVLPPDTINTFHYKLWTSFPYTPHKISELL